MGWKPRPEVTPGWAIFLRAVNVGGRKPLPMVRLRELLAGLGARSVATYIQSGNAVFAASLDQAHQIQLDLEEALAQELDFAVPAVLRSIQDIRSVLAANPFANSGAPANHVHVLLSRDEPSVPLELDAARFAPDEARLVGRDVYARYPNGVARSKLTLDVITRALDGTILTGRNIRTLNKVITLAN